MDFVEWSDFVLATCVKTGQTFGLHGKTHAEMLSAEMGMHDFYSSQSTYAKGMFYAIQELQNVGLMESSDAKKNHTWNVSQAGREHVTDQTPFWWSICQEKLDVEHAHVLHIINQLSQKTAQDHAWLEIADHASVVSELNGTELIRRLWIIEHELERWDFVSGLFAMDGSAMLHSTYKGLVWETRRGFTLESKLIDDCVKEWETTSVEFKQYLYVQSVEQKAEFIKDILSLANTKASGPRWLFVGFSNRTREYANAPNPAEQDDLERILAEYTDPPVEIRYAVVTYRKGPVGKLEVLRDPKKVPYRVAKSLGDKLKGDKKQIFKGQILVRHGSQVQEPSSEELQALLEEGEQARSQVN